MRAGWLLVGLLLGAAGYYAWTAQGTTGQRAPRTTLEPRHRVQDEQAAAAVGSMIDEVVHNPDIPETPVKQAFEHAIEG